MCSTAGVLEACSRLTADQLAAVADLERRVVAVDGGRLKLEWGTLRSRTGDRVEDLLWWDGERLVGFAGLYAHGGLVTEIAGMVDPAARRAGIGARLLDAAVTQCLQRGEDRVLVVVPRPSVAGRALLSGRGGVLEHSEHAMVLDQLTGARDTDPVVTVRPAYPADAPDVTRLLLAAFGNAPATPIGAPTPERTTLMIDVAGRPVGTLRCETERTPEGPLVTVYAFAVAPELQGRGIGRTALRRTCADLLAGGVTHIALEVAAHNERALGVYASLGFRSVTVEDYWALPTS